MTASADLMPGRIAALPVNKAGYPVPWFVATIGGKPDFRVIGHDAINCAMQQKRCWVCGMPFDRGEDRAFVIGPMCAVNRVTAEPPAHRDCAEYSATHCPFLITPNMTRRDKHQPDGVVVPAGISISRNPGVALVWVAPDRSWTVERQPRESGGGVLFRLGEPAECLWYARGRTATRAEVLESIDSGLPVLRQMAEEDGALDELEAMHAKALAYVPAAP
jgi:hypothetical protein